MEDNGIITAIIISIILGILGWGKIKGFAVVDRHRTYKWLILNTKDEPGKSHVETATIAKGTKLPEDRVRNSCMSHDKIYRYFNGNELWSVWREYPQSIYDVLSKEETIERMMI